MTECNQTPFHFANHFQREVVAGFDGGSISSEAGSLLLRQVEQRTGIVRQFANGFEIIVMRTRLNTACGN